MKIFDFIKAHKILMALVAAGIIIGGYFLITSLMSRPADDTRYQTARVASGTITQTISGSGQVADANEVSLAAAVSGEVTKIYVGENESVAAGDLLFQLDVEDYNRTVAGAKIDLEKAELQLETLRQGPDTSKILAAQGAIEKARADLSALKLKQKQERAAADANEESATAHLADLNASDPNYDTLREKYTTQLTTAQQTLESLDKTGPADLRLAEAAVREKEAALDELQSGATEAEIRSQELLVEKARNDLSEVQDKAEDYQVRAPFDGVVTTIKVAVGDSVSGGGSGTSSAVSSLTGSAASTGAGTSSSSVSSSGSQGLATLVTGKKQAAITVNEVDRPSLKTGQSAAVTFDAIADLTLPGTVTKIDAEGTASSGVVTYGVIISLNEADERVADGMTASAEITVAEAENVLVVSSAAVSTRDSGASYVKVISPGGAARQVTVQTGLTNDTETEIISGLKAGEEVVISETSNSSTKTSTNNSANNSASREREGFMPMSGGMGGPPQ